MDSKGKDSIIGYAYEPWHIRYAGDIAENISKEKLTCGCADSHLYEAKTIRNEVTPSDNISDTWITVSVDETLYVVHKPFFEIIYDGDISLWGPATCPSS